MSNAQIPKNYLGIRYFYIRHLLKIRNYNLEILLQITLNYFAPFFCVQDVYKQYQ